MKCTPLFTCRTSGVFSVQLRFVQRSINMTLATLIAAGFLATPLQLIFGRQRQAALTGLLPDLLFCGFASYLPTIAAGQTVTQEILWIPSLAISMTFRLVGLVLLFALLMISIGTLILSLTSAILD